MVELFEQEIKTDNRQSSKGNQLKWQKENEWYKADYTGYEGLAEYVVSGLLKLSSLDESEFVSYETEQIAYKFQRYRGCRSGNFLPGLAAVHAGAAFSEHVWTEPEPQHLCYQRL